MEEVTDFGTKPFSASNGPIGALVLHGITGSPRSVRPLGEAFANAGFSVEVPLLPGHGTTVEEMLDTNFDMWLEAAQAAHTSLMARCDHVVVAGLSMGGTLALQLALDNASIAGLILINPMVAPPAESFVKLLDGAIAAGVAILPSIGSDVKREGVVTGGYSATPVAPLRSLMAATPKVAERLNEIVAPTMLFSSLIDHVVPTDSSDLVEERIGGPIERVVLENSFHVATLDNDAGEIEERSIAFALKVCAN